MKTQTTVPATTNKQRTTSAQSPTKLQDGETLDQYGLVIFETIEEAQEPDKV